MVIWVTPANFIVIVEEAAKLLPETVTVVPTTPLVGLKVMPEVTVNEAIRSIAAAVRSLDGVNSVH